MKTKIFLDSGDPAETREALRVFGALDGQTTNPSLIAKNPATAGKKFSKSELIAFYRFVVEEISSLIPQGSVSVEVYADRDTLAGEMFREGKEFFEWIPNAHIKYPTTAEGLKAARMSLDAGMRVNMTLVFSQEQAAAVYAATLGVKRGDVFISPFVGRLDDRGERGMDLIKNIFKMYFVGDGHVEILTASVRSPEHIEEAIALGSDILTAPLGVLKKWRENEPRTKNLEARTNELPPKPILYQEIDLGKNWKKYDICHELTDKGLERFARDWNNLIG